MCCYLCATEKLYENCTYIVLLAQTGALYVVMCYRIPSNSSKPIFYDVSKNIAIIVKISNIIVKPLLKFPLNP